MNKQSSGQDILLPASLEEIAKINFLNLMEKIKCYDQDLIDRTFSTIIEHYSEHRRNYHNLNHIICCLKEFKSSSYLAEHPNEVETAIWFHDIIKDNEEESRKLAICALSRFSLPHIFLERVEDLILITKHDKLPSNIDEQLIIDIDLTIFGQKKEVFDEYEENIKIEYKGIKKKDYNIGRIQILQSFLKRKHIYNTDYFRKKYEKKAIKNLKRIIKKLNFCHAVSFLGY